MLENVMDGNTTMPFKIKVKQLLKKYNQIWKRVEKLLKRNFNSEPVYGDNDKYIKIKIKIYNGSMITNFQGKKMQKEKAPCKFLSIIILDSFITEQRKSVNLKQSWKNANMNKKA